MGQNNSTSLPSADPNMPYFSLTFQSPDNMQLALADETVINMTRKAISDSADESESQQRDDFVHYEGRTEMNTFTFKFHDLPFMRGCSRQIYLRSKRMCCKILETYEEHGWRLIFASDLSRAKDMTTWFFARKEPGQRQYQMSDATLDDRPVQRRRYRVVCVSTSSGDSVQLINADETTIRCLAQAVRAGYAQSGVKQGRVSKNGDYEIQLCGSPWSTQDVITSIRARRTLLEIIKRFESNGYEFYGAVNTTGTSDSLFFIAQNSGNGEKNVHDKEESVKELGGIVAEQFSAGPFVAEGSQKPEARYCAINLSNSDCLRVIDAPAAVLKCVLRACVRHWPGKVQDQNILDQRAYEFILRGNPWWSTGGEEATAARVLVCGLLEQLHGIGWLPMAALDVTRQPNDKAFLIFRCLESTRESLLSFAHATTSAACSSKFALFKDISKPYWCLSMQDQSKIRLINAPEPIRDAVRRTVECIWPWGVQNEREFDDGGSYQFKLKGGPWGAEQQNTTTLMCYILKTLRGEGCKAVLSADVTGRYVLNNHGGSHSLDVHSWFLTADDRVKAVANGAHGSHRRSVACLARSMTTDDEIQLKTVPEEEEEAAAPMKPQAKKDKLRRKISAIEYAAYTVKTKDI